jgi:uncharacterized protein YndB with AHSA1/START domain
LPTLTCEVELEASAETVYAILTTADRLSRWWRAPVHRDLTLGSCVALPLADGFTLRVRIDALDPPKLVAWTCLDGVPEWERSTLRFDLTPRATTTLLRLTHEGWRLRTEDGALASSGFSLPRQLTRLHGALPHGSCRSRTPRPDL